MGAMMQDEMTITTPAAAAVFAAARSRRIVEALIPAALPMSALARTLDMPLSLAHYHVGKLRALGLIRIEREDRRAGRVIKHYRAAAHRFFVPAEHLGELPGFGLDVLLRTALDDQLARSLHGILFSHDGQQPRMQLIRTEDAPNPSLELWLDIGLSRADALALIADLRAVIDRYRLRGSATEPRHLVHVAAVRV
jgi:DNA-binding transcriptional ArsR family regulator